MVIESTLNSTKSRNTCAKQAIIIVLKLRSGLELIFFCLHKGKLLQFQLFTKGHSLFVLQSVHTIMNFSAELTQIT